MGRIAYHQEHHVARSMKMLICDISEALRSICMQGRRLKSRYPPAVCQVHGPPELSPCSSHEQERAEDAMGS
jgi:hypothetical protein